MRHRPFALGLLACLSLLGPLGAACSSSDEGSGTTGKRVTLKTRVTATPDTLSGFTTGKGYQVKLSRALVSLGAFYYYDGVPAVVSAPRRAPGRLASALGLGVAHAHPGHYVPGTALGQMLTGASIDLLAGPSELATGEGVSGTYRSATFSFAQGSSGAAQAQLGDSVALLEGAATKDGKTTYFRLSATYDDINLNLTEGHVTGCPFQAVDVESDGTVTATVQAGPWLNLVDFDTLSPGTADAPTAPAHGDKAQIEFALGLAQIGAYSFSFAK